MMELHPSVESNVVIVSNFLYYLIKNRESNFCQK